MILLYDAELAFVGPIETAIRVGYDLKLNDLSTATLVLPFDDPMTEQIVVPASYARIYDGERDLGFFRFAGVPDDEHAQQGTITYSLQSAECTLLDGSLTGWHELGGTGLNTRWVMNYVLAQQPIENKQWTLGACEFEDYYQYNFEDTTLLESLMSLGEVLMDDYQFRFDSTNERWTASLVHLPQEASRALVYGRNAQRIRRSVDGRVVTRLYGRGYGEGDNQLTIASVNGGRDYLDADAEAMHRWGVRVGIHVDTRQTDPATLKAHMERILAAGKQPTVSYEADAIDLWRETGESWDDISLGDKVLVLDTKLGGPVSVRVTGISKEDIDGDPGRARYTLDNRRADTAEELNEIRDKIGIHELYSQGATNMYSMQIADNADASHPLTMRFYVPGNVLRINSCLMRWQLERFRTYATLAKSGGGSVRTSQEGGGATVSIPQMTTSVGVTYSSQPMDTEGSTVSLTGGPKDLLGNVVSRTESAGNHAHNMTHTHVIPAHTHPGGLHAHNMTHAHALASHAHAGKPHSHNMTHAHAIASHDHAFEGEATTYSIAHNHSLAGTGAQATGAIYSGNKSIRVTPVGTVSASGVLWTSSPYDAVGGSVKSTTGEASAATEGSGVLWTSSPYDAVEGSVKNATEQASATTGKSEILWSSAPYAAVEGESKPSTGENGAHTHLFSHVHDMPHVHNIAHQHIIPSMRFDLEPHRHSVTIPEHTHELEYGVYEGSRAQRLGLRVDGTDVPSADFGESMELDIAK